jgi:hypothetical protein
MPSYFPTIGSSSSSPMRNLITRTTTTTTTTALYGSSKRRHPNSRDGDDVGKTDVRIRALRQRSSHPLVFTIDEFLSADSCRTLFQGGRSRRGDNNDGDNEIYDAARLEFATLVAGELFGGQWSVNDGLRYNRAMSSINDERRYWQDYHCHRQ